MELDVKPTKSHTWPMTSLILLCGGHEHTTFISSVQFSPLTDSGGMRDNSAEILFQTFLQDALVSSSGMGRYVHSLVLSIQHLFCRPQRRPPSKVPSCRRRFLWTHKEVDLASHLVIGLVLQVEDSEKFPQALRFESLDPFFLQSQRAESMFHSHRGRWR